MLKLGWGELPLTRGFSSQVPVTDNSLPLIPLCFNFNKTFAMIIQDIRGQIGTFLSKYAYFAENVTFDPPGCL